MSSIWFLFDAWRRRTVVLSFIWVGMSSIGVKAIVPDSADISSTAFDSRNSKYQAVWSRLIPIYFKIQYAGGMGLCNVGGVMVRSNNGKRICSLGLYLAIPRMRAKRLSLSNKITSLFVFL